MFFRVTLLLNCFIYFPFSQIPPLVLCQFLDINVKKHYVGFKLFTEKVNTLLRAEMGGKYKVNKCPKMPTDSKYQELISKIAIEFLMLNSAKNFSLSFFISAESFYPTQYFRLALYYQTSGASGIINFFPLGCLKKFSSTRHTYEPMITDKATLHVTCLSVKEGQLLHLKSLLKNILYTVLNPMVKSQKQMHVSCPGVC